MIDTESSNELELFSNSQIQAAALATNALLNDNINQVVYNVSARLDEDGNITYDHLFGLLPAQGEESVIFTISRLSLPHPTKAKMVTSARTKAMILFIEVFLS